MTLRTKNLLYTAVLLLALFIVWKIRGKPEPVRIEGATMGTTYHITYFDENKRELKSSVDSVLIAFNSSLSTYQTTSEISAFNSNASFAFKLPFFYPVLKQSEAIVLGSDGAFDPTVMPLVNAWGFGPAKAVDLDSAEVDSILAFVGFDKIHFNSDSVWKDDPRVQLDFSAIAKGYGVDLVGELLRSKGITDFFVEIGGEVLTGGENRTSGQPWRIGIIDPVKDPSEMEFLMMVHLSDKALATSGNYYNYREVDGRKVSHTIDPTSGYPVQCDILSASVFAADCVTADGWATAFMVMGIDAAKKIVESHPELEAIFVYSTLSGNEVYVSEGANSYIIQDNVEKDDN